jgi:hypothetical protein
MMSINGNPVPELLVGAEAQPVHGLCLAQTQDAAFDKGLITLTKIIGSLLVPICGTFCQMIR